jgi:hypothetical protein
MTNYLSFKNHFAHLKGLIHLKHSKNFNNLDLNVNHLKMQF